MIDHDLAPVLAGKDAAAIDDIYDFMEWHIHYVGRGGIASFATSAIDIALWDLKGKREQLPLWKMAGGKNKSCKAYCGGIDLAFPLEKLLNSIKGYLESGFNGVKIKVGQKNPQEDIERIKAVRQLIGPDITFMIDANYSLTVDQAIALSKAVESCDITGLKSRPSQMITMVTPLSRKIPPSRWRWAKTCIPFMSSAMRWIAQNWALFSRTPLTAGDHRLAESRPAVDPLWSAGLFTWDAGAARQHGFRL